MNANMMVRTRIAPSPTGDPHVGTAYVALFNMMFAKKHGGVFILRLEDTDQVRSKSRYEKGILESLRWLGLNWDEGPDIGGEFGPYRQSERKLIYRKYADQLLGQGNAFHCFCSSERLLSLRKQQSLNGVSIGYDGQCLELSDAEISKKLQAGDPHVLRMKIPREGKSTIIDLLRGKIEIEWSQVDMQILLKSDGMPTYHLANVIDDHLMKITHVIRGEEWINSAPKHKLLYEYFGWEMPVLCHVPLLRNPDKTKLSKRKNPVSIGYYRSMGYLPEAMINYLGRMGWSMPDEREKFSLDDMCQQFDIERMSLGAPIFDLEKLDWLNARWIREDLTVDQFADRLQDWLINREYMIKFLPLAQERVRKFSDFMPMSLFMFSGLLPLTSESFSEGKLNVEIGRKILQFTLWRLEKIHQWNKESIFIILKELSGSMGYKLKDFNYYIFVAISATSFSWSVIDSMAILGCDMTKARLYHAISILGGTSKKVLKIMEKEYEQLQISEK